MENDNKTYIQLSSPQGIDCCARNSIRLNRKTKGNKRNYPEIFSSCLDGTMNLNAALHVTWTKNEIISTRKSRNYGICFVFLTRERGQELFICTIKQYLARDFSAHTCAIFVLYLCSFMLKYISERITLFMPLTHSSDNVYNSRMCVCVCV